MVYLSVRPSVCPSFGLLQAQPGRVVGQRKLDLEIHGSVDDDGRQTVGGARAMDAQINRANNGCLWVPVKSMGNA